MIALKHIFITNIVLNYWRI